MGRFISSAGLLVVVAATAIATATTNKPLPDYVIVGAGPAGMVLAEHLSRDAKVHVVLIEAGPDSINSTSVNTPAKYLFNTEPFWNYTSVPDPNLNGTIIALAQGRTLGGGSAVNGMAYCRGASSLFDEWATLSGNPGLAWNSLFQDFLEVSSYRDPPGADYEQFVNKSAYGNGPLEVSRSSGLTGFEFPFAAAIKSQLGLQEADLSDGTGIGVDLGVASIYAESRTRSYARKAFGNPIWVRPNVQVIVNAWVSKINFSGKRATSVTYHSPDGTVTTVKGKEFIISGGSINTPKLLMLSGVGPKKQLSALRIPVVADIPAVGSNLRDHAFSIAEVEVTPDIITVFDIFFNSTEEAIAQEQYNTNSSGPLGWNNGFVYASFRLPDSVWDGINGTHYTTLPKDRPHILLEFSTVPFINTNVSAITMWASLVQPESSGYVALNTSNFKDDPLIFTNFYKSEADKAAIMAGYKQLRALFGQSALKEKVVAQLFPGPDVTTDQQIWATIQKQTYSFHHPVGTVAIGKALNSNWRLKGLNGIRVVDSSTFPYPTTCHPQAVVYALANRAAKDIIREDNH